MLENLIKDHRRGALAERLAPGRHLIQNHAEGKQISASIQGLLSDLFLVEGVR